MTTGFYCLCSLGLAAKLNFNILKAVMYMYMYMYYLRPDSLHCFICFISTTMNKILKQTLLYSTSDSHTTRKHI